MKCVCYFMDEMKVNLRLKYIDKGDRKIYEQKI